MSQERVDNLFASESWTAVYTAFTNVSLKAYDFDTIRAALVDYVATTYPDKFNDFIASSEFIAILDLVAYLGHSLSFRLDMNTRENFLDTAERRESVLRMAKTLGYNKTRPTNARGFLKITSITTDQPIADNEGNSLANRTINWNDSNNTDWYENFIDVINAALTSSSKIQDPMASMVVAGVENYLYELNETDASRAVSFSFEAPVSGKNRRFEAVRTEFTDDKILEAEPIETKKFTIVNRNDNLGPASDRTGFFVYAKTGNLQFENFSYSTKISNLIETVATNNISNTDVWAQRVDNTNTYSSSVTKVDNDTRETAVYNSLRNGNGDIVSVNTINNNAIELHYGDGVFGNAASGNYRVWYRVTDNENYRVDRNDVKEKTISIPYTGADNKNYRLVLTLSSTRDFSENFAAESYTSVRRIAPRSYYAQDRMVNAQDYNVLPLSLGSNIVSKVKAVNTTYAGNSRYFEMDDVTGHHSNISITGTDGSVYMDDDAVTMNLRFNRQNGNATDFIRNEITKVLRHPSLANAFYYYNKDNMITVDVDFNVAPTSPKTIVLDNTGSEGSVQSGDFVKLDGDSGNEYWTQVVYGDGAPVTGLGVGKFEISDVFPESSGAIKTIVRGIRTRLEVEEISSIASRMSDTQDPFILKYELATDGVRSFWVVYDDDTDISDGEIALKFTYNSGIRNNEAEYKIDFLGKTVVFESNDQVKFYYGNDGIVVDNESNLANRDKLLINYYDENNTGTDKGSDLDISTVTLGYTKVSDYNETEKTFSAFFVNSTGAPSNLNFLDREDLLVNYENTTYYIVAPDDREYPIKDIEIIDNNGVIGHEKPSIDAPNYQKDFLLETNDNIPGNTSTVTDDELTVETEEYVLSSDYATAKTPWEACVSTQATTVSIDDTVFINNAKGEISLDYLSNAGNSGNFIWINTDKLDSNTDSDRAKYPDIGTNTHDIIERNGYGTGYDFTFEGSKYDNWLVDPDSNETDILPGEDNNIKWKQFAYSEITFKKDEQLSLDNLVFKYQNRKVIDNTHLELKISGDEESGYLHTVVFWTEDTGIGTEIDVFLKDNNSTIDFEGDYMIRADTVVTPKKRLTTVTQTYKNVETYIYDKFTTSSGYVDNNKVKLAHFDSNSNPFGILEIFKGSEGVANEEANTRSYIVLEEYIKNGIKYERVSTSAVATNDNEMLPDTAILWYNTNLEKWNYKDNGDWSPVDTSDLNVIINGNKIYYYGTDYRVVEGRSYVEDPFMSFRWDHYADVDKRIDPSTSNIIDLYVLTSDYVRNINEWIANGFSDVIPASPNNFELRKIMESIEDKAAIGDHVSYIPVKFKMLFGEYADAENQAVFKVIAKRGTAYTNSEIKSVVAKKVNEYFNLDNWDFGDQFYFSELAAYLHQELSDYISSVVITPKYSGNDFKNLLSINCEPHEIFLSVVTSKDVKIISSIADNELTGE